MKLTVVNLSRQIRHEQLEDAIKAIQIQVDHDFVPEWNTPAQLRGKTMKFAADGDAPVDEGHDAIIYIGDRVQDEGDGVEVVMGYHGRNQASVPYGFVYLDVSAMNHRPWTVTLSHEVLELLADPNGRRTVRGPDPLQPGQTVRYYLEVCDPTQNDKYSINGIHVSNFVRHGYINKPGDNPSTNHLDLPLAPFGFLNGGYATYIDADGLEVERHGSMSPEFLERRKEANRLMKLGRRVARRALNIESLVEEA